MDTGFMMCVNCYTVFEVGFVADATSKLIVKNHQLLSTIMSYKSMFRYEYQLYNFILPGCCNKPDRRWAYGLPIPNKGVFPFYHMHMERDEFMPFIEEKKLKLFTMKDYIEQLLAAEVAAEL